VKSCVCRAKLFLQLLTLKILPVSGINYIQHQQLFITRSGHDKRLHATDISLYFMLFHCWNKHHFQSMFPVNRRELMQLSHIGSREAYISSIRRLHDYGYIIYRKSFRQFEESSIMILPLFAEQETGPLTESENWPHLESATGPAEKQGTGPHTGVQSRPQTGPESGFLYSKTNINNVKRERVNGDARPGENIKSKIPKAEEVQAYFSAAGWPDQEARKFYFHYQAIGWTLSGTPIWNWQAAAQKWAEKIDSFTPKKNDNGKPQPGRLHVNENKRYDIPL
jgi:hypothetical protein